jgi:hypothetical protein
VIIDFGSFVPAIAHSLHFQMFHAVLDRDACATPWEIANDLMSQEMDRGKVMENE